ncbi:MAG: gamma-glutamyltransferase family protein [Dehalococcoidia bacterium]
MTNPELVHLRGDAPRRGSLRGTTACVAADHPLAASAGVQVLLEGGSAADAAVAMAAVMVVVQPQYSHLGGDVFALVYDARSKVVRALNSSGPAPASASADEYRLTGGIPDTGAMAVTVPGCVAGWWELHRREGRMPWEELLRPAIRFARSGFPASRGLARAVPVGRDRVRPREAFEATWGHISGDGGQQVVQPVLADTLAAIAAGGQWAFYDGVVRDHCLEALGAGGAVFAPGDWRPPARWEAPLDTAFAGHRVYTQPPPSRGLVLLRALQSLATRLAPGSLAPAPVEGLTAIRSAFGEADAAAGDPDVTGFDARAFLASPPASHQMATGSDGDTTYLLAIDADGNAVSLIQSIFAPWGSGLLVPATGILMNNRMDGFTLEPGHPNVLAAGKRPMHTLHCYMATTRDGSLALVGGTPGAHRQPQTNLQVLDAILRRGSDPQDALDAPRWGMGRHSRAVDVEYRAPGELDALFRSAGMTVERRAAWDGLTGRAYVARVGGGAIAAAADMRGEGQAVAW